MRGRAGIKKKGLRTRCPKVPGGCLRGGYLLSRFRSIIDVARFNFSVRDGKRWSPRAMAALIRWEQLTPEAANLGRATDLRGSEAGGIRGLCLCVCPCGCTVDVKARHTRPA